VRPGATGAAAAAVAFIAFNAPVTSLFEKWRAANTPRPLQNTQLAGDVLHFPPNVVHGATMLDEEVVLIDIFTPIREDFLAP
jgi:hypothetical protein